MRIIQGTLVAAAISMVSVPVSAQSAPAPGSPEMRGPVAAPIPVVVKVDASTTVAPANPVWRFFGADEPNYATMKDGRTTLETLGRMAPGNVYFRTHNLLTSGDGTPALKWGSTNIYTEDAEGRPVYNWTIVDHIFDTYRERGVKPYVELGFMPEAMSTHPQPYQHDFRPGSGNIRTGWAYPPRDYAKWEELIYRWVSHCVDRYGRAAVATWYFQTWNEANLGKYYWAGTPEEFFKLHDAAIHGVRRALPEARVGGPDIAGAGDDFLARFMAHVQKENTPTDFLSFHAKGQPEFIRGGAGGDHVRMGISAQLKAADHEFAAIEADAAFRNKPIVIGESDPEGCAACQGPANAYRNGTMYSSYTAASFPRLQALALRRHLNLQGVLTWAFEFEDQPYFAGFRQLTSAGIDMPVINVFKMLSRMDGNYVSAVSDHQRPLDAVIQSGVRGEPDIGTVANFGGKALTVMVWHYHDDDLPGPDAAIHLELRHLPAALARGAKVIHYQIDHGHSNSYAAWQAMGSPIAPTTDQRATLIKAAELDPIDDLPGTIRPAGSASQLDFTLPRQGVALIEIVPLEDR
ncbi:MAG: beta-xylosidase [Sphingomonas sp.]